VTSTSAAATSIVMALAGVGTDKSFIANCTGRK
jgi:hypothetical protein